jgi:hypothetical protein
MKARGYTVLTAVELSDELQFTVVRYDGWLNVIAIPITFLFPIYILWQSWAYRSSWVVALFFLILILLSSDVRRQASWLIHGRTTRLSVTNCEFVATGNILRLFSNAVRVPTSEARKLSYWTWLGSDGLYVNRARSPICVLPGLGEIQTKSVIDTIFRRFPEMESTVGCQTSIRTGNIVS